MIESIKTTILWLLICLSIFLTWNIWTFQPEYDILNVDYIDNTMIGEEKSLVQVIRPKQLVVHQDEVSYMVKESTDIFHQLYANLQDVVIDQYTISNLNPAAPIEVNGVEVIFPLPMPSEIIRELLPLREADDVLFTDVDRLILFINEDKEPNRVYIKLYSSVERLSVTGRTNLDLEEFKADFLNMEKQDLVSVFLYRVAMSASSNKSIVYLPVEEVEINSLTYMTEVIAPEQLKQVLFNDPNNVKHYMHPNGDESFTDGSRMVNIVQNGDILRYINPGSIEIAERSNRHMINSSIDFLNSHGGLTTGYYIDHLSSTSGNDEIVYRLTVNQLPVLAARPSQLERLYEMRIFRSEGNQIEQYVRSLFRLNEDPLNIKKTVTLPSGYALSAAIEQIEDFNSYALRDIAIGYVMEKRQSFIIFEPSWFILYNNQWVPLEVEPEGLTEESDVEQDGLE